MDADQLQRQVLEHDGVMTITLDKLLPLIGASYVSMLAPKRIMDELDRVNLHHITAVLMQADDGTS